ncbi:hypothetical protein FHX72_000279 [Pseudoclavibacter helvolus]|uniref:Uncharacterized protein n=1 Tax=Pseudoclavibacter helvolus TaxID=255205 RepID=A0A7W4UKL2_9MICO|nr:hypothetical protein [Pseudoclavibacter helvolus]
MQWSEESPECDALDGVATGDRVRGRIQVRAGVRAQMQSVDDDAVVVKGRGGGDPHLGVTRVDLHAGDKWMRQIGDQGRHDVSLWSILGPVTNVTGVTPRIKCIH